MPSSTSSLVMHRPDRPLTWALRLSSAASNQPQRRLRPVVTPFSAPTVEQVVAHGAGLLPVELGRERAAAHARAIGLGDAQDVVQHARADAGAGGGVAGHAVAGGHVGIGAVVHVQQRALRAFEQQVVAVDVGFVQLARDVGHHRLEQFGVLHRLVEHRLVVDGRRVAGTCVSTKLCSSSTTFSFSAKRSGCFRSCTRSARRAILSS